jgi:hypothetical protein
VTAGLAANHLGIAPTAVLARMVKDIVTDKEGGRELAAQLHLSSAAVIDAALGSKRFADEIVGEGITGRLAEFVIRAQGLQAWTEGLKRAFSTEFFGMVARQADHAFADTDPAFQRFLARYGFTPAEWDEMRATPQIEAQGARFFDTSAIANQKLADRLRSAMIDERRFAVVEPDSRVRQITSGGARRGTLMGEIARSSFMFKSFSMSILTTHLMRAAMQGSWGSRAWRLSSYLLLTTIAGAASMEAGTIASGHDPANMDDPRFWGQALFRGGGLGFYGDFLYSAVTRGSDGIYEAIAGPVIGFGVGAVGKLLSGQMTGAALANYLKQMTPGSTLWYTRIATDRLIFDQLQSMIDPKYRQSFARFEQRMLKDYGQRFWWRPGKTAPDRGPDLGAAWKPQ